MCGIAGIFTYGPSAPPVDREELLRIRDAMIARGPDGAGLWMSPDQRVGLAHRRLAIIDLTEAGAQPMATADGRLHITFNGEIYNYQVLRRELEAKGYRFHSHSDTEVLLHLYADRGQDMVHALRGMYSFAIWDERKKGLFLARDPFGIKPLYVADNGHTIRVASQVKALLKGGAVDTTLEPAGHVGFFLWGHVPEPYTLYKGIRALGAGTSLWIDALGSKQHREFFNITDEIAKASSTRIEITRAEMQERLHAALVDSVRHHMIADVPVGIFLSSGLDSTTLTALARETDPADLRTITLGFREFQGTANDEVPLAEVVAKHYGTLHQTCWVTKEDFQQAREHLLDAMDQPSTDAVNSYFVSKAAADAGLKVALSGLGGDELFGGYPSFGQIPALVKGCRPFKSIPLLGKGFRILSAPLLRQFTSPKYAGILEYGGEYGSAYLLRRGMYMPWELPDVMDRDIVREGWQELQTSSHLRQATQGIDDPHLKVTALETTWYMRNQLLRDTDWASMAHSLETRVPLVDTEVLKAVVPLLNSNSPPNKLAMAASPRSPLPKQIIQRQKTGFSVPIREWLVPLSGNPVLNSGLRDWASTIYRELNIAVLSNLEVKLPVALIFRIGQMGDTLVALPAIELIRRHLPNYRLILLTDRSPAVGGYVSSWDVCKPTGWFDSVIYYEPKTSGLQMIKTRASLLIELRSLKVDKFFNLAPSRTKWQIFRDRCFFDVLAGVRQYSAPVARENPQPKAKGCLPHVEPEWRRTIGGIGFIDMQENTFRLPIPIDETDEALRIAADEGIKFGPLLLAVGPGSKMPAKIWSSKRFATLGSQIQNEFPNLRIIVFGGKEDIAVGNQLCSIWGPRGHNLAGKLSIYGSAALLERCNVYVGNDSGTMHLAAMVGAPCVAIFSARDYPGRWEPYGKKHIVLRSEVECAGCMLETCEQKNNKCLDMISVDEVFQAVKQILIDAKVAIPSRMRNPSGHVK